MILIVESALRTLALAAAVWTGLVVLGVRNAQLEKLIWTTVLAGAIAMPAVVQWRLTSVFPSASFALPGIAIRVADIGATDSWHMLIVSIYAAVFLALLARLAIGFGRMWWVRRGAVRVRETWTQDTDVRVAETLSNPVTFGATILLPKNYTSWSDAKRSAVLAHENAHVRHLDCQIQWIAALHECVFWFSPLAWWLRWRLAELAEHASDDAVVRGSGDRADYAALLLEAAQARPTTGIVMSMASGRVARRIERILSDEYPGRTPASWQRALGIALVLPAIALAGAAAPVKVADAAEAQSISTPRTSLATNAAEPRIVATVSNEDLRKWYPEPAKQAGSDGLVQISVTLDSAGRATDTLVISESPVGMGFGAAASRLVHTFTYANPTGHPAAITFNVKFELGDRPLESKTTDFESDESRQGH
jgi:TonB family protein